MSDLESFRAEVRVWLQENAPPTVRNVVTVGEEDGVWGGRKQKFKHDDQRLWLERMAARGWTVPEWPKEYGGGGLTFDEAKVLRQEMQNLGLRRPLESLGIDMLGPALMKFGSEEQKREHLPRIARGEIRWCQGYSEPGAGSDLASVRTRGDDMGDHFLVNGSKMWTSFGDKADMIFALVRTEPQAPKHMGISFVLIDMDDPGVTTKPIRLISGESPFTATFFDNVKVPKENVVGERGRGWDVTKYLLQFERQMIGSRLSAGPREPLPVLAKKLLGEELAENTGLRSQVLDFEIDTWAFGIFIERWLDQTRAKSASPVAGPLLKVQGTELGSRRADLVMALEGVAGLENGSRASHEWLFAPSVLIGGGTTEIQLNVIAKRGLGLPGT